MVQQQIRGREHMVVPVTSGLLGSKERNRKSPGPTMPFEDMPSMTVASHVGPTS